MTAISTKKMTCVLSLGTLFGVAIGALVDFWLFASHGMALPLLGVLLSSYVTLYSMTKRYTEDMTQRYVSVLGYSAVVVAAGLLGCYVWMQSTEELYRVAPVLPVLWAGLTVVFLVIFFCVFDTIRFVLS